MLTEGPVYWSGLIKQNFTPNTIREVNLTLRSGVLRKYRPNLEMRVV